MEELGGLQSMGRKELDMTDVGFPGVSSNSASFSQSNNPFQNLTIVCRLVSFKNVSKQKNIHVEMKVISHVLQHRYLSGEKLVGKN